MPEFLRWAALKNALSYYSTNVYICTYVTCMYAWIALTYVPALAMYARACALISGAQAIAARMQLLPAACTGHACARWQIFREIVWF